jgi:hypothetical protein
VFSFGDARFEGSTGSISLTQPIVGMAVDPKTGGYWLVASDGGIFAFNAPFYGSVGHVPTHIVAMTVTPDGGGYWLAGANGTVWSFGDATRFAGLSRSPAKPIVVVPLLSNDTSMAASSGQRSDPRQSISLRTSWTSKPSASMSR